MLIIHLERSLKNNVTRSIQPCIGMSDCKYSNFRSCLELSYMLSLVLHFLKIKLKAISGNMFCGILFPIWLNMSSYLINVRWIYYSKKYNGLLRVWKKKVALTHSPCTMIWAIYEPYRQFLLAMSVMDGIDYLKHRGYGHWTNSSDELINNMPTCGEDNSSDSTV